MQWIRWVSDVMVNTEYSADLLQTEEKTCGVSDSARLALNLFFLFFFIFYQGVLIECKPYITLTDFIRLKLAMKRK